MANKPKWLEEGTTQDLLGELVSLVSEKMAKADVTKAKKIIKELKERFPEDSDTTIVGVLDEIIAKAEVAKVVYEEEVLAVEDDEDEDEDDSEDEDEDEDEEEEDDSEDEDEEDEDEEEDEEEVDLDELSLKELKKLAKEDYGIKRTKDMKRTALIKAIVDASEDEEDEDEDYEDYTIQQLRKELKARGMKVNNKATMPEMRKMLIAHDKKKGKK